MTNRFGRYMLLLLISTFTAAALLFVFYLLSRWALHGDGYWPRGLLGVVLALIFILGLPWVPLAFFTALKAKQPIYWVIPPLHNTRSSQ